MSSSLVSAITDVIGITSNPKALATVEKIAAQIADTEGRIKQLERDHARACLDWADDPSNASVRDKASADLYTARVDLAALQSALKMARERNGQDERRRLAALNASRLHSCTMHLRAAHKAATELSAALEKAAKARRVLLEKSAKARASAPSPLPRGSLTEAGVLQDLIANEMHRVSHDAGTPKQKGTGALPGSRAPSLLVKDDPASITPLADQLEQAHDWSLNVVRGEIAIERTPLIAAQIATDNAKLDAVADAATAAPAEPAEYNEADLVGPPRSAEQIMASMPRAKLR
jgi:hypothetical protein